MISTVATSSGQQAGAQPARRVPLLTGPVWILIAVVTVVAVGMACAVSAGLALSTASGQVPPWRENLSFVLSALALVLMVVAAVRAVRARLTGSSGWGRAAGSRGRQYSRALRRVRRGHAVPEPEVPATVTAAQVAVRQGSGALLWVGLAVTLFSGAVGMEPSWSLLLTAAGVVSMGSLAAIATRDARCAHHWLATHQPTGEVANS